MNFAEKRKRVRFLARRVSPPAALPSGGIDIAVFHMLHLQMPISSAERSFLRLKRSFVDWNEVRISSVREIQAAIGSSMAAEGVAQSIHAFLWKVHQDQHETSLEFLNELTIAQVRRYLRSVGCMSTATIDLILRLKKAQSIIPLDKSSERVLVRIGIVPSGFTTRQKQRFLQRLVPEEEVVNFHRSVVDLARRLCPEDEEGVRCRKCPMRRGCTFCRRLNRQNGARTSRVRNAQG